MNTKTILVVRVPDEDPMDLEQVREQVRAGLEEGVLVLREGAGLELLKLPPLGEAAVRSEPEPKLEAPLEDAAPQAEPEEKRPPKPAPLAGRGAREKRDIMARLQAYRKAHGLGCFAPLAKAGGKKLTESALRDMISGDGVYELDLWRAADRALTKLERRQEGPAPDAEEGGKRL